MCGLAGTVIDKASALCVLGDSSHYISGADSSTERKLSEYNHYDPSPSSTAIYEFAVVGSRLVINEVSLGPELCGTQMHI